MNEIDTCLEEAKLPENQAYHWKAIALGYTKLIERKFEMAEKYPLEIEQEAIRWKNNAIALKQLYDVLI